MKIKKFKALVVVWIVLLLTGSFLLPVSVAAESYQFTVTTDGNGTVDVTNPVEEGTVIAAVVTPNSGYVFDSMSVVSGISESEVEVLYSGWPDVALLIPSMPGNDVELYVTFAEAVLVQFDANGGSPGPVWENSRWIRKGQSETFQADEDIVVPPDGKSFRGVEVNGTFYGPGVEVVFSADSNVKYLWDTDGCEYVVDANGGTKGSNWLDRITYEFGWTFYVSNPEDEDICSPPEGMVFDGMEVDGVRYPEGEPVTVPEQETGKIRYLWRPYQGTIIVNLDPNGGIKGEAWVDAIEQEKGSSFDVPDTMEPIVGPQPCYAFDGIEVDGTAYPIGATLTWPEKESVTVKPLWKPVAHQLKKVERVEPTATAAGTEGYWRCSSCGRLFSDGEGMHEISGPVSIPPAGGSSRVVPNTSATPTMSMDSLLLLLGFGLALLWKKKE